MTASALYTGTVRHRRHEAQAGAFEHEVSFAYLDLDELPSLLGGRLVRRRPGLVRVRRRDLHGTGPVKDAIRTLVARESGRPAPTGPVRVLTTPRTYGLAFNPVSFYYCFDEHDDLDAVVAEVTNTPWRQRHAYVLREDGAVKRGAHDKVLHVSPFQDMDHRHVWSVTAPGPMLSVHIENHRPEGGAADFDATLNLRRAELGAGPLLRHPAARTVALIYAHAASLKLRGARHFPVPA